MLSTTQANEDNYHVPDTQFHLWSPPSAVPLHCSPLHQNPHSQKALYAEKILDQATSLLAALYPSACSSYSRKPLASLKTFVRDFLKKSKTTFSTLQLALLFLVKVNQVPTISNACPVEPSIYEGNCILKEKQVVDSDNAAILKCGRRMFLASLIVASKVILEPAPKNTAWARLSGLQINEINKAERLMLGALDFKVVYSLEEFVEWNRDLHLSEKDLLVKLDLFVPNGPNVPKTVKHSSISKFSSSSSSSSGKIVGKRERCKSTTDYAAVDIVV